jgi:hypothetical protein
MACERDQRVGEYMAGLPDWQQAIGRQLRDLIHAVDPEIAETIKRTVQPYFVLQGNVCALLAAKDHVNLLVPRAACGGSPQITVSFGPRTPIEYELLNTPAAA